MERVTAVPTIFYALSTNQGAVLELWQVASGR